MCANGLSMSRSILSDHIRLLRWKMPKTSATFNFSGSCLHFILRRADDERFFSKSGTYGPLYLFKCIGDFVLMFHLVQIQTQIV